MKIVELPTLERRSPLFECENCGRRAIIAYLNYNPRSNRLSCFCGKDSITIPQNASDWKITRNIEHESTCEPIGRDGPGDRSSKPPNTESMTLADLKRKVDAAIEVAIERHESPDEIPVTLQIETSGSGHDAVCAHEGLELHYDGGAQATGCVLCAWISEENDEPMRGENGTNLK